MLCPLWARQVTAARGLVEAALGLVLGERLVLADVRVDGRVVDPYGAPRDRPHPNAGPARMRKPRLHCHSDERLLSCPRCARNDRRRLLLAMTASTETARDLERSDSTEARH